MSLRRARPFAVLAVLFAVACSGSTAPTPDAGTTCLQPGDMENYCSVDSDCCSGGFCDAITKFCRSSAQCGVAQQWCTPAHPCCAGSTCQSTAVCSGGGPNP